MIRFTLRLTNKTHKAVFKRAEKAGVSMNRQLENEASGKAFADQHGLDLLDFWESRKRNRPGVLEHPQIEMRRVLQEFKESRL